MVDTTRGGLQVSEHIRTNSMQCKTLEKQQYNYCRRWLFSTCAYKLWLQETMRLTDSVRLTSGIIIATPSMRKHVWSWTLNNYKRQEQRWQAPQCQTTLYFFTKVIRGHHIFKGIWTPDSKNRRVCTSSTRSRKPSWSKCCGFAQTSRWNGGWTCA